MRAAATRLDILHDRTKASSRRDRRQRRVGRDRRHGRQRQYGSHRDPTIGRNAAIRSEARPLGPFPGPMLDIATRCNEVAGLLQGRG